MKVGKVVINKEYTGQIRELENDDTGIYYEYQYKNEYIQNPAAGFISVTIPLSDKIFFNRNFPTFFENLIPEGWLLNVASKNWKIRTDDKMELLLNLCNNSIGNIEIYPENYPPLHTIETQEKKFPNKIKKETKEDRCLCCYGKLSFDELFIHKACSQNIFGSPLPPDVDIDDDKIEELAIESLNNGLAVTGAQKKLSIGISGNKKENRLTIMDFHEGNFILKPLDPQYKHMQEKVAG